MQEEGVVRSRQLDILGNKPMARASEVRASPRPHNVSGDLFFFRGSNQVLVC